MVLPHFVILHLIPDTGIISVSQIETVKRNIPKLRFVIVKASLIFKNFY